MLSSLPHTLSRTTLGFSTGALAKGDVRLALRWMNGSGDACLRAVELSALRESELQPLVQAAPSLPLQRFAYVSVHAPSHYAPEREREIAERLHFFTALGWPIVVHPDALHDFGLWREFGALLLVENMDKRKPIGRTATELARVFARLPQARLCFDIGHAQQIDPTMSQALCILQLFGERLAQLHLSAVDSFSVHRRLNLSTMRAFSRVSPWIPRDVPVILETPVPPFEMHEQLKMLCEDHEEREEASLAARESEVFAAASGHRYGHR